MHLVEEKWDEILLTVKREHELTDISFNTWLKPLQIFSIQNNRIYILVSGEQMGLTYINRKYYLPLKVAVAEVTGTEYEIEFVLPEQAKKLKTPHPRRRATTEEAERSNLNPNYTFDTFVVGNNNRFAHSAALAVAESPAVYLWRCGAWQDASDAFHCTFYSIDTSCIEGSVCFLRDIYK